MRYKSCIFSEGITRRYRRDINQIAFYKSNHATENAAVPRPAIRLLTNTRTTLTPVEGARKSAPAVKF